MHGLCLVLGLGALGVAAWAVISGRMGELGVDGLFLLVVALLFAAAFLWGPLEAARKHRQSKPAPAQEKRSEPVAAGKAQGGN